MRIVWICNMPPQAVNVSLGRADAEGNWLDHALSDLIETGDSVIRVLYRAPNVERGDINEQTGFASFLEVKPDKYYDELEKFFAEEYHAFSPDVIHIWGTEYGHTLAAVNAAEHCGILERVCISIQGLCSVIAKHYTAGIPERVTKMYTFRDFIQRDNLAAQKRFFARRGELEIKALQKVQHVIGRTPWDRKWTKTYNPDRQYHFCNETLRMPFYDGLWSFDSCEKHSVFASSCSYPIKGFHYLLEAFAEVVARYPDAILYVTGNGYFPDSLKNLLRLQTYQVYLQWLTSRLGLKNHVRFTGKLSAEGMKQRLLSANVFVLPSVVENSPNSLGEAMLLGVPCVAADVGGVSSLMSAPKEGIICQSADVSALTDGICQVFAMEKEKTESMGHNASLHAQFTHDAKLNTSALVSIYSQITGVQKG